ncbi:MAG: efflux RND transporter periplasmic adaptor subunit [bacterium]|nr:efflux RND transporter periplasmic adaptor subunit [Gammaproteobacteria bacterium]HIL96098.1 efflux RND transporter periplasmic adaptor subunit [Pseudomonadales bacterium]
MKNLVLLVSILVSFAVSAADQPALMVVIENVLELEVGEPVVFNGVIRSRSDISLPVTVDGELLWVLEEGERIARGGVIAKVDDRQLRLRREEQQLLSDRAKINIDYLQGEVDRLTQLQEANLAAKTLLAEITSRRDFARNDYLVSLSRLAQLDETLSRTEVVSPVDAVVVERLLQGGEFARRGESIVRILDPSALEVQIAIPVSYLNRLDTRVPVNISVGELQFDSHMRSVIQVGDPRSQTFDILVDVATGFSDMMVAGQFADAMVSISEQRKSLFVPRDAVVLRTEGNYVYRIGADNVAKRVSVTIGEGQGSLVSVSGDLREGDQVAVRGVERLTDGQAVVASRST